MTWLAGTAQRPVTGESERVFNIDINECEKCQQHNVSIIACIADRLPARSTLSKKYPTTKQATLPPLRAPPDEEHDFTIQHNFNFGA